MTGRGTGAFLAAAFAASLAPLPTAAASEPATFATRSLTPETALKAAQAALARCRANGYQVAVAVVDRDGLTQVLLRDRYAGAHTLEVASDKAWSAASFRIDTAELERATRDGAPLAGLRHSPRVAAVAGGVVIAAAGSTLGAIGVSGAPGGDADAACAAAGVRAIADDLEF